MAATVQAEPQSGARTADRVTVVVLRFDRVIIEAAGGIRHPADSRPLGIMPHECKARPGYQFARRRTVGVTSVTGFKSDRP